MSGREGRPRVTKMKGGNGFWVVSWWESDEVCVLFRSSWRAAFDYADRLARTS